MELTHDGKKLSSTLSSVVKSILLQFCFGFQNATERKFSQQILSPDWEGNPQYFVTSCIKTSWLSSMLLYLAMDSRTDTIEVVNSVQINLCWFSPLVYCLCVTGGRIQTHPSCALLEYKTKITGMKRCQKHFMAVSVPETEIPAQLGFTSGFLLNG